MEENTVTSGVEASETSEPVAAEQEPVVDQSTTAVEESTETPTSGVEETAPAAGEEPTVDKQEVAFAKRLAAERAKIAQESRDAWIAEQGYSWQGKSITTEAEYKQALREQEIMKSLEGQNVPPEIVEEIVAGKRDRERLNEILTQQEFQKKINSDIQAFQKAHPSVSLEAIDPEVYSLIEQSGGNLSLLDAYNRIELPKEMARLKQALEVKETNAKNAGTSPGSVTGNGTTQAGHFTKEQVESMTPSEIKKNLDQIIESQRHW